MKKLIHEIHRRSLWQVLGIYLVGSWLALQVVDVLANNFGLPEWFPAFALALLVIGLPIVLATAFVQEGVALPGNGDGGPEEPSEAATPTASGGGLFTWYNAIAGGVAAFALLGVVTLGWWIFGGGPVPQPGVAEANAADPEGMRSVAVLPFVTRSSVEEDAYFADGMHDDLLTQLSKIQQITVISRTSVERYRDTDMSIPDIASELGVSSIVEGGIQRAGNRVRVNMQLIEAATDRHLWAETYDEELTAENLFHIQSDLAQKIADALQATLTPEVVERLNATPTESLEAFDLYTRGRYIYGRVGQGDVDRMEDALALFRQAVEIDSTFALAWGGIADAYHFGIDIRAFDSEEALPRAWFAVERALELDPNLAEALSRRALLHLVDGRTAEAEADFERALELNPGSSTVIRRYGALMQRLGRPEEALAYARRVVQIDPVALANRQALEDNLWGAGLFEEGAEVSRRTVSMEPTAVTSWYNLGWFLGMLEDHVGAVEAFETAVELSDGDPANVAALAWAHALAGDRDLALAEVASLPDEVLGGHDVANVYWLVGEKEQAFELLEAVLLENPNTAGVISRDWSAAGLREDPRYADLLDRLNLEG